MSIAIHDHHTRHATPAATLQETPESSNQTAFVKTLDLTEQESKVGGRPATWPTSSVHLAKASDGKYQKYAQILRRRINTDGDLISMTLEINSLYIRKYLQSLIGDYPSLNLAAFPVEIKKPYGALFHFREKIRAYTLALKPGPEKDHLEVLVNFMKKNLMEAEQEYQQNVVNGKPPKVSFDDLWTLLHPTTVVVSQGIFDECAEVLSYDYDRGNKVNRLLIEAVQWDYNGEVKVFGPARVRYEIRAFLGLQQISTLNVCPLEYAEYDVESSVVAERMIKRGRRWRYLVNSGHQGYSG